MKSITQHTFYFYLRFAIVQHYIQHIQPKARGENKEKQQGICILKEKLPV